LTAFGNEPGIRVFQWTLQAESTAHSRNASTYWPILETKPLNGSSAGRNQPSSGYSLRQKTPKYSLSTAKEHRYSIVSAKIRATLSIVACIVAPRPGGRAKASARCTHQPHMHTALLLLTTPQMQPCALRPASRRSSGQFWPPIRPLPANHAPCMEFAKRTPSWSRRLHTATRPVNPASHAHRVEFAQQTPSRNRRFRTPTSSKSDRPTGNGRTRGSPKIAIFPATGGCCSYYAPAL
jgi:hypothetical protein